MRRFVELERTAPGVHRVKRVFETELPTLGSMLVSAPAGKSDAEILSSVIIGDRWMPASVFDQAPVEQRGTVKIGLREIFWSGHVFNMGGYAKANRELILRVRNSVKVQLVQDDIRDMDQFVDPTVTAIMRTLKKETVSADAPLLRFYTPKLELERRYRICWTMMETQRIHHDFVQRLNTFYDEAWIPTPWYAEVFRNSGVRIPIHTMPLGVNTNVFRPTPYNNMPSCELVTTSNAGRHEVPKGFLFFYVFQPTFRKGVPFLSEAFEAAFAADPDAALVLGTTAHGLWANAEVKRQILEKARHSRIYLLSGDFLEQDLARFYNASHAFVCSSMGEGWNLPMCEAGACGRPVIIPRNTSHLDLVDDGTGFLYDTDGEAVVHGSESVCGWYDKMPFSKLGKRAKDGLVGQMREVKSHYSRALVKAERFMERLRKDYTWDRAADRVLGRMSKLWG